jgi:hypothetical protein
VDTFRENQGLLTCVCARPFSWLMAGLGCVVLCCAVLCSCCPYSRHYKVAKCGGSVCGIDLSCFSFSFQFQLHLRPDILYEILSHLLHCGCNVGKEAILCQIILNPLLNLILFSCCYKLLETACYIRELSFSLPTNFNCCLLGYNILQTKQICVTVKI